MVKVELDFKQLSAILKASFGGKLSLKDRQELGFIIIDAKKKMKEVI